MSLSNLAPGTLPILIVCALVSHGLAVIAGWRCCRSWHREDEQPRPYTRHLHPGRRSQFR